MVNHSNCLRVQGRTTVPEAFFSTGSSQVAGHVSGCQVRATPPDWSEFYCNRALMATSVTFGGRPNWLHHYGHTWVLRSAVCVYAKENYACQRLHYVPHTAATQHHTQLANALSCQHRALAQRHVPKLKLPIASMPATQCWPGKKHVLRHSSL